MRHRIGVVLGAFALVAAVVLAGCQQATTSATTSNKVQTVIANVKGQIVDSNGVGIPGITLSFDAPNGVDWSTTTTTTTTKSIQTTTTDKMGNFSLDGLATGTYNVFAIPTTTTSGTTTTVDYMAESFSVTVPTISGLGGGTLGANMPEGYTTVNAGQISLPNLGAGGSIKATIVQNASTGSAPLPVATKQVIMQFKNGLYYPTYNTTTKALTYSTFITATTDATGLVTFSGLPYMWYGDQSGSYPVVTNLTPASTAPGSYDNGLLVELNAGVQINTNGVGAQRVYLPGFRIGSLGLSKDVVITDKLPLNAPASYPALAFVSTSTKTSSGDTTSFDVTKPIVLTFNNALSNLYTEVAAIYDGSGNIVKSTAAISGSTLTITPAANLAYNATYYVFYKVTDGKTTIDKSFLTLGNPINVTAPVSFTTAMDSTTALAAPTDFAFDTTNGQTGKFNAGNTSIPVSFTYNSAYSYYLEYTKTTAATGLTSNWVTSITALTIAKISGSTGYATISVPAWVSGDSFVLKLAVITNATGAKYAESNPLTLADAVAPTSIRIGTGVNAGTINLGTQVISGTTPFAATVTTAPTISPAPSATVAGFATLYLDLSGSTINRSTFSVAVTTATPKIAIDSVQFADNGSLASNSPTYVAINIKALPGAAPLANLSGSGETIKITGIADGAGNALVDNAAATVASTTLTF
ncbi:MAG: Ig-like domain-containing protein [Treponema sp.]|nr:Ig-like domain-containing protein [Treponema sp.]